MDDLVHDMFDHYLVDNDDYEDMADLNAIINLQYDDHEDDDGGEEMEKMMMDSDDTVLSQKFSQLSATTTKETKVPHYLSEKNSQLKNWMEKQICFKDTHIEDIRSMAIVMHKLAVIKLQGQLWLSYIPAQDVCIWPVKVKSFILSKQRITTELSCIDEDRFCRDISYKFIQELNQQEQQYQEEISSKKSSMVYTDSMEECLNSFIEQHGIRLLRLKCQLKRQLIKFDYQEQLFQLNYRQQQPTHEQVSFSFDFFFF